MMLRSFYNNEYMKNMLKQNTWIMWMSLLVNGLCTVLPMLFAVTEKINSGHGYAAEYIMISNVLLYFIAVGGAKITGIGMFKYLNNKSEVDFYHSIPVKKNHLFFYRYMAGVTAYLAGLKIAYFTSAILGIVTGLISPTMIWQMFVTLVSIILIFLATYSFVVLGCIVSGNKFIAIATAFGIMFSPIIFSSLIMALCQNYYDFMSYTSYETLLVIWKWTNPIYGIFTPFTYAWDGLSNSILQNIVQWIVVSGGAYYAFIKRPSENAGKPVAVKVFQPIIKTLGVLGASLIGGVMFGVSAGIMFYVSSFIVGFVFHIAFEMLFEGDVKAGLRNMKHFAILYAVVAITFTVIIFDMTGYDKKMTSVDNIKSITYNNVVLEERENIEILNRLIAEAVMEDGNRIKGGISLMSSHTWVQSHFTTTTTEELLITKKNGRSYRRTYPINVGIEELEIIETSKEYIDAKLNTHISEKELESIINTNAFNKNTWVSIHTGSIDITGVDFVTIYKMLEDKQDLLTTEYIKSNTPVVEVRTYVSDYGNYYLYIYGIHTDVLKYLGLEKENIVGGVNLVVGNRNETEFDNIVSKLGLNLNEDSYRGNGISAQLPWDHDLIELVERSMVPIYGDCYLDGNYNQYHKELVFIENIGNIVGYITMDELTELTKGMKTKIVIK